MRYIRLKNTLIVLFLGLGIWFNIQFEMNTAWPLYVAALVLILTNYLFGTVWLAFRKLKAGKIKEAEQILKMTKHPGMLTKTHKAYYFFIRGMIALQHKRIGIGQEYLLNALKHGLRSKNDEALVTLNLAHTYFIRKAYSKTGEYLKRAKSCNSNDLMIRDNVAELEKKLTEILGTKVIYDG